jgi:glycosyltransferase involved in cell wall biosynthesis
MLSILIPVYNFNIVKLVAALRTQSITAGIPFEIIVVDDCSSELLRDQNMEVSNLSDVQFHVLAKNIGRSRIRNRLANMAQYPTLLFLDCDSEIPSDDYIQKYLPYCNTNMVVCGGNIYSEDPPEDPEYLLRWLYGIKKEQRPSSVRNINPYRSFMTNNFIMPGNVFHQIHFDESIIRYGHEDTLFGLELKKKGIPVKHINNPVYHIGLEIASEFLRKTSESIENLLTLLNEGKIIPNDIKNIRLLRAYAYLKRYRIVKIYLLLYEFVSNAVMRNLLGSNPGIFAFDLYKLALISKLIEKHKLQNSSFT